jgi:hypothetical protein
MKCRCAVYGYTVLLARAMSLQQCEMGTTKEDQFARRSTEKLRVFSELLAHLLIHLFLSLLMLL